MRPTCAGTQCKVMAATATSQYLLRWNDHLTNYSNVFFSLREQEEFVDCSIACEDGIVGAHRIVLAGCSTYLQDLFARVAKPHPVIILPNTSRAIVLMLMEFIYRGQVHIPEHHLQQLVVLGHALQVKGLTKIMVPVSTSSSKIGEPDRPINSPDFPHGQLSTNTSSSPFYTVPYCNATKLGASVLSCDKVQQAPEEPKEPEEPEEPQEPQEPEEEKRRRDRLVEEEEKEKGNRDRLVEEEEKEKGNKDKDKRTSRAVCNRRARCISESIASVKSKQPAGKLYMTSAKQKGSVGAYAFFHGIEAAKSYVKEKYNVKVRVNTLNRLILFYQKYEKAKEMKAKRMLKKRRQITSQK